MQIESADRRISIQTVLGDAEAAIQRHIASRVTNPDDARRSIDAALESIYRASNVLKEGNPTYWEAASRTIEGRTMQAIIYMRGRVTHRLVETHEPEILVPSPDVYPSEDLFTDVNYYWNTWDEMADEMEPIDKHDKRDLVEQLVAGRLVVESLRRSVRYLSSIALAAK